MEEIINKTIQDIKDKLEWAKRSLEKLKTNRTDKNEIQDNFWSFLTAFKTIWFYYNRMIEELTPNLSKEKRKDIINNWKSQKLSENEQISWDILHELRNQDTHNVPVKTNYEIRLEILTDYDDAVFTDYDDTPFSADVEVIFVIYNGNEYEIEYLTNNGIECINKLIKYLPNLKNNWC